MLTNYIIIALISLSIPTAALIFLLKKKSGEIETQKNNYEAIKENLDKKITDLRQDNDQAVEALNTEISEKEQSIAEEQQEIKKLQGRISALSKYEGIANANELIEKKKKKFIADRNQAIANLKQQVQKTKEKIKAATQAMQAKQNIVDRSIEAKEKRIQIDIEKTEELIVSQQKDAKEAIKEQYKEARKRHEVIFMSSTADAADIILRAEQHAEEIAGNAAKAANDERRLDKAIKAMKNTINGYGEEYLLPTYSLIDELADEYDFKQAGQELQKARENVRLMIKNETAADCDYVQASRRHDAIHFVLDAFNGKVATILAKVRHDNYGKLRQQMLDAFNLVNHNGNAFRSAKINQQFLDQRLDELKWAVAVHELKLQDREEQKKIKQEMRDEARAIKEYEKAMKAAKKEEKMLQDAMEKARRELATATEAQKDEYEARLRELEEKLVTAEEKNQRALSMAQQTRRGHVYVISNIGSFGEDVLKIGLTRRLEPMDRVKELGDASVPFPFDVHAMMFSEDAPALEKQLHQEFNSHQVNKVNQRKEFFRINVANVKDVTADLGIEGHWTIAAEAREYKESMLLAEAKQHVTGHV